MERPYWRLVWSAFLAVYGWVLAVIGLVALLVVWIFSPQTTAPLKLILPLVMLLLICVITFAQASYQALNGGRALPRVRAGLQRANRILLLLEPSDLFSFDGLVSVYHVGSDNFERLIGLGVVVNIQQDRRIQVELVNTDESQAETLTRISQNNAEVLDRILVKPHVPSRYLETSLRGGK